MAATSPAPSDVRLEQFVTALEERRRLVYDYLDQWPGASAFRPADIHDAIYSYVQRRGKALRPIVLLLCCGAAGGDEGQALPAAAAVEVFHTWTLVHDDMIDRDDTRRGSPTVHAQYTRHAQEVFGLKGEDAAHYGRTVAILAGDLQQSWSFALMSDLRKKGVPPYVVVELVERMATWLTPELLEGEMLDVQYSLTPFEQLTEDDVLRMLSKKTATLLEYAAWCGAKIGLGSREDEANLAVRLGEFARLCGTAFQLHDDLLGLTADETLLGKPVGSDLREGKRTLIIYRALARVDEAGRRRILSTLGNPSASPAEIAATMKIIEGTGAIEEVSDLANSHISQAQAILGDLPPSPQRQLLEAWANYLLARRH
jgi:geranylgeranyl diphosphate synthase type I